MASRPLVRATAGPRFDLHAAAEAEGNVCARPSEPAPRSPNPPVGPAGVLCDAALDQESDDHADILDIQLSVRGQPFPPAGPEEPMLLDHPCARRMVDTLSASEKIWLDQQFLDFYCDSTRQSMQSKFAKFEAFCARRGVPAFPAA